MIARWFSAGGRVRVAALAVLVMAGGACDKMPLTAPTESTIQLSAAPTVPLNGSVDVVATVIEGSGTPVQNGTLVSFTATLGRIDPAEARTENGTVTVKFVAGNQSGEATVTALSGAATSTVTDTETAAGPLGAHTTILVGGAAATSIALRAEPGDRARPRAAPSPSPRKCATKTATRCAGVPVSFSTTAGQLQSSNVITNASGEASTTLTTSGAADRHRRRRRRRRAGDHRHQGGSAPDHHAERHTESCDGWPAGHVQRASRRDQCQQSGPLRPYRVRRRRLRGSRRRGRHDQRVARLRQRWRLYGQGHGHGLGRPAGQSRSWASAVLPRAPLTVTLTLAPATAKVGGAVIFTANVGTGVTAESFDWNFGGWDSLAHDHWRISPRRSSIGLGRSTPR